MAEFMDLQTCVSTAKFVMGLFEYKKMGEVHKILIILLFSGLATVAQPVAPQNTAQLKQDLIESKKDTNRVKILISISHNYNTLPDIANHYKDTALIFAKQAEVLSRSLHFSKGIGLSYQEVARYMIRHKNFKNYKPYIDNAVQIFRNNQLKNNEAEAWLLEEEFYVGSGGQAPNVRITYYEKAKELFTITNNTERLAATLKILGDLYQTTGDKDKAYLLLQQSLALFKKTNYRELQGLYDLLAHVASLKGDFTTGVRYGLAAVRTAQAQHDTTMQLCTIYNRLALTYSLLKIFDQADLYYRSALNVAERYKDTSTVIQVLLNEANILTQLKTPEKAIHLLNDRLSKYHTTDQQQQVRIMLAYMNAYLFQNRLGKAGQICSKMQALALSIGFETPGIHNGATRYFIAVKNIPQARLNLAKYDSIQGNNVLGKLNVYLYSFKIDSLTGDQASALRNHLKYTHLKDSLFDVKKNQQIEELKIRYESEKQHKDIISLKKAGQLQREKLRQANFIRNITIAGLLVTVFFISLLFFSYRVNKRNAIAITENNIKLKELINEKEWLLKEIHHRVKNNLQIVTGLLQRQSAYIDNDAALAAIQNSENRMHAIALIHQKLYQSEDLNLINMPDYVEEMLGYLKDSGGLENRIVFEKHIDDIELDVAQAVPLGLIINEAVTNAIKYAYADDETGTIYVTLVRNDEQYNQLTIADDGRGLPKGFDIEKVDSLGINLMRGLCKQLAGTFEIGSEQGCTINIIFKTEIFSRTIKA